MAKRQNFIVGSTNVITQSLTDSELNHGFDQYEILTADELDGVFNSVSDFSNDSSNEIANAIQSITGSQPTGASQTELAAALQQMRSEIETTSLTFKGYVATSAPSSSTYALVEGNLWINSSTMPTSFPVAASSIKRWNGTSWVNYGSTYTPADFDFFRNINDNEGYYWFGGMWTVMSTDMSSTYFTLNQSTGKWEIKSSVNLPGAPTIATAPAATDNSKKIATTSSVVNFRDTQIGNCVVEIPNNLGFSISNNTLTLHSGSNVFIPNGAGVFTKLTLTNNVSNSGNTMNSFAITDGSTLLWTNKVSSGGTAPTSPSNGQIWYDTANNIVKRYNNGSWVGGFSLPVAVLNRNATTSSAISDVEAFDGFGYIGSTVFVLPDVVGLIANGRNPNGTLKNTRVKTTNVLTGTYTGTNDVYFGFSSSTGSVYFQSMSNYVYSFKDNYTNWSAVVLGSFSSAAGVFSNYKPKCTAAITDYNEAVLNHGDQDIRGTKTMLTTNSFRFIGGNSYGTIFHSNGNKFYLLLTDQNDPRGTFNSLRPFTLDCGTGTITTTTPATTDKSDKIATTEYTRKLLETIYPVGSLYFGTQSTCPLASLFGTWTRVPSGYALWTGNGTGETNSNTPNGTTTNANYANAKPNTTIAAGLPNITGGVTKITSSNGAPDSVGALYSSDFIYNNLQNTGGNDDGNSNINIDASRSSSIYGASSTVQPPAYIINVWRRTA